MARGLAYVGTSGWHYQHWVGPFYPPGLAPAAFLPYYSVRFRSVEIDSTFYRLPTQTAVERWRDETPDDFVFSCKASRYITHMKRLKDPRVSSQRFLTVIKGLGHKLGPILFQLPPHWEVNTKRLAAFLDALPGGHRFAFEFRNGTWFTPVVCRLLESAHAAFCIYDLDRRQSPVKVTADFAYLRLHGPDGPYGGCYDDQALRRWAMRCIAWREAGLDVFCYFDNDEAGYAAQNAATLRRMMGGQ
ncbi:MAG: DUF72 domain-containing protein [Alphaproteobacteria bacterium]